MASGGAVNVDVSSSDNQRSGDISQSGFNFGGVNFNPKSNTLQTVTIAAVVIIAAFLFLKKR